VWLGSNQSSSNLNSPGHRHNHVRSPEICSSCSVLRRGTVIGDRTITRHLSHSSSIVQPIGAPPMYTEQQKFLTALVRLNVKIRGHKAQCHSLPSHYHRGNFAISLVVLSARQGLSPACWHPPGPAKISGELPFRYGVTAADVASFT
jgi:hypothetical protein